MSYEEPDGNALLMGGEKVKSCSFKGDFPISWEGEVLEEPKAVQQRDYDTDEPLWWDDEMTKPRLALVIKLQTNVIDPDDPDDTGVRALWVKAESQKAVAVAVRQAGEKGVKEGGYLWIEFYDEREDPPVKGKKSRYPTKLYRARYTPPQSQGNRALMDQGSDESARQVVEHRSSSIAEAAKNSSAILAAMKNRTAEDMRGLSDGPPPF